MNKFTQLPNIFLPSYTIIYLLYSMLFPFPNYEIVDSFIQQFNRILRTNFLPSSGDTGIN
jgi:hypothetical protein